MTQTIHDGGGNVLSTLPPLPAAPVGGKMLSTVDDQHAAANVLVAASGKGGVGRSSILAAIAWILAAEHQRRVVLLDTDFQASLTRLHGVRTSQQPLIDAPVSVHGMALFAGGAALRGASRAEIAYQIDRARSAAVDGTLLVDTRPDILDDWHRELFGRSGTFVLAVTDLSPASVPELRKLVTMSASRARDYLIIGNKNTRRSTATRAKSFLQTAFPTRHVAKTWVPTGKVADLAFERGAPAPMVDPRAPFSVAIRDIAAQLVQRGVA